MCKSFRRLIKHSAYYRVVEHNNMSKLRTVMVEIIDLKIISLHYGIYLVPLAYLSPSNIILLCCYLSLLYCYLKGRIYQADSEDV